MKKAILGSLILAIVHSILFYGQDFGISVLLFAIPSIYLLIALLKKNNKIKNEKALYLSIPILLLSSTYLFFNNSFFNVLNIITIPTLLGIMIVWSTADTFKLKEIIGNTVNIVLGSLEFIPNAIGMIKKVIINKEKKTEGNEKRKKIKLIFIGILCSIPILLLIISLLMSADGLFAQVFDSAFKNIRYIFSSKTIINLIGRIIVISFITVYLVCIIYNILNENSTYNSTKKSKDVFKLEIDETIVNTILTIINIVYLVFSFIQLAYVGEYLFRGIGEKLNFNFAEYARQGFFQLMFITFINFAIIILTNSNKKPDDNKEHFYKKLMNILMCIFTVIIAVSAFMRMRLYEKEYGYTFLRLMVYFILTTEIIMIIPTIIYILKGKINLFKSYFLIVTVMYVIVNFSNIDSLIAKNNVARATKLSETVVRKTDLYYLTRNLGTDAIPEIIKLYEITTDKKDKIELNNYLYNQYKNLTKKESSWQEFNLSKNNAKKLLEKMNLEYIDYYKYDFNSYSINSNI